MPNINPHDFDWNNPKHVEQWHQHLLKAAENADRSFEWSKEDLHPEDVEGYSPDLKGWERHPVLEGNDTPLEEGASSSPDHDPVNNPSHYTAYDGLQIIDLTEQMNLNRRNAVKYVARAGLKNKDTEIEDLEKAGWYIQREIERLQKRKDEDQVSVQTWLEHNVYSAKRGGLKFGNRQEEAS